MPECAHDNTNWRDTSHVQQTDVDELVWYGTCPDCQSHVYDRYVRDSEGPFVDADIEWEEGDEKD